MTVRLSEVDEPARVVEIDAGGQDSTHVFLDTAFNCFMFDRQSFIEAVKREFGLVDALEVMFA